MTESGDMCLHSDEPGPKVEACPCDLPCEEKPPVDEAIEALDARVRHYTFQRNSGAPSLDPTRLDRAPADLLDIACEYQAAYRDLLARLTAAEEVVEANAEDFRALIAWADSYPIDVFGEPDLAKAHEALQAVGMTLDSVSAHIMRRTLAGVKDNALAALARHEGRE